MILISLVLALWWTCCAWWACWWICIQRETPVKRLVKKHIKAHAKKVKWYVLTLMYHGFLNGEWQWTWIHPAFWSWICIVSYTHSMSVRGGTHSMRVRGSEELKPYLTSIFGVETAQRILNQEACGDWELIVMNLVKESSSIISNEFDYTYINEQSIISAYTDIIKLPKFAITRYGQQQMRERLTRVQKTWLFHWNKLPKERRLYLMLTGTINISQIF